MRGVFLNGKKWMKNGRSCTQVDFLSGNLIFELTKSDKCAIDKENNVDRKERKGSFMARLKKRKIKDIEDMVLKDRISYGYKRVIIMMLISGVLSLIVIGVLLANMIRYVDKVQRADTAVKICRIDINSAARNIREMALNSDTSTYDGYKQEVVDLLAEVDSELKSLKGTGIVSSDLYQEFTTSLSEWGTIGYSIMSDIESGKMEEATQAILNECTPALNNTVEIGLKLDKVTDRASSDAVGFTVLLAIMGILIIVICLALAIYLARKLSGRVLESILTPLHTVEEVAKE